MTTLAIITLVMLIPFAYVMGRRDGADKMLEDYMRAKELLTLEVKISAQKNLAISNLLKIATSYAPKTNKARKARHDAIVEGERAIQL